MFKSPGRITQWDETMTYLLRDARVLIGHCRWATHGHQSNNANNHPHPVDAGWLVHNGVIRNHRTLARDFGLCRSTDCDSEVIGLLFEQHGGTRLQRLANTCALIDSPPFACLALWGKPRQVIAARNGHPLHFGMNGADCYVASLPGALPGKALPVPDRTLIDFTGKGVTRARI